MEDSNKAVSLENYDYHPFFRKALAATLIACALAQVLVYFYPETPAFLDFISKSLSITCMTLIIIRTGKVWVKS